MQAQLVLIGFRIFKPQDVSTLHPKTVDLMHLLWGLAKPRSPSPSQNKNKKLEKRKSREKERLVILESPVI